MIDNETRNNIYDKESGHNFSDDLMFWYNSIKLFKLIFIIMNCSYFLGMFWITFCEITRKEEIHNIANEIMHDVDEKEFAWDCVG